MMTGPSSSRGSRSILYERYDVHIKTPHSSRGSTGRRWFDDGKDDEAHRQPARQLEHLPIEEWTNVEMIKHIYRNASYKSKLLTLLAIAMLSSAILSTIRNAAAGSNSSAMSKVKVQTKQQEWRSKMDPDSHKRSNPFAPEGQTTYMTGVLEVKRIGGGNRKQPQNNHQQHNQQQPPSQNQQLQQQNQQQQNQQRQQQNQQQRQQQNQQQQQHQQQQDHNKQNIRVGLNSSENFADDLELNRTIIMPGG